jgi:hypothetical protein
VVGYVFFFTVAYGNGFEAKSVWVKARAGGKRWEECTRFVSERGEQNLLERIKDFKSELTRNCTAKMT